MIMSPVDGTVTAIRSGLTAAGESVVLSRCLALKANVKAFIFPGSNGILKPTCVSLDKIKCKQNLRLSNANVIVCTRTKEHKRDAGKHVGAHQHKAEENYICIYVHSVRNICTAVYT